MTPEEEEDAIATMMPRGRGPTNIATEVLMNQKGKLETVGNYIAASLDSEFRGPEVILEGECVATVTIRDRQTGMEIGSAKLPVRITYAAEHQR